MDLCVGEGLRGFGKVTKGHCLRGWEVGVGILAEVYFLVYYTKKTKKKLHIQVKNDTILYFVFPRLKCYFCYSILQII